MRGFGESGDPLPLGFLLNLVVLPTGAVVLTSLSSLLYGVAFVAPRYFMVAASTLVVASGMLLARNNQRVAIGLWLIPYLLTVGSSVF